MKIDGDKSQDLSNPLAPCRTAGSSSTMAMMVVCPLNE
jgi:hypothetical protein